MARIIWLSLILVFSCFAHASKSFTYYSNATITQCYKTHDAACNGLSGTVQPTCEGAINVSRTCEGAFVDVHQSCPNFDFYGNVSYTNSVRRTSFPVIYEQYHSCPDGQYFVLNGCDASCSPVNPCDAKKDQEVNTQVQCGTYTCSAGGVLKTIAPGISACTNGPGVFIPISPPNSIIKDNCRADSGVVSDGNQFVDNNTDGKSSATAYCDATYKYNGQYAEAPDTDSANADGKVLPGVVAPGDGGCPDGYASGQLNGANVCVKNDSGGTGDNGSGDGSGSGSGDGSGSGSGTGDGSGSGDNGAGDCDPATMTCDETGGTGSGQGGNGTGSASDNCDAAPSCSDSDAIECQTMTQVWKSNCALMRSASQADKDKVDDSRETSDDIYADAKDDLQSSLTGIFGDFSSGMNKSNSAQCISDTSFTVFGRSITIPFNRICPFFQVLHALVLIFAYMFAARIVWDAFKTD